MTHDIQLRSTDVSGHGKTLATLANNMAGKSGLSTSTTDVKDIFLDHSLARPRFSRNLLLTEHSSLSHDATPPLMICPKLAGVTLKVTVHEDKCHKYFASKMNAKK